jgi:hypothetical protein
MKAMHPMAIQREYLQAAYQQDYNKRLVNQMHTFYTRTQLNAHIANFVSQTGVALSISGSPATMGRLNISGHVNYSLTNYSPTWSYVTVYFLKYSENTGMTFSDMLTRDYSDGLTPTAPYTNASGNWQLGMLFRLKDAKCLWENMKCIGKQSFRMDGGACISASKKLPTVRYYYNSQKEGAALHEYLKGITTIMVIKCTSQLVKQASSTGENAITDNAKILSSFTSTYRCWTDNIKKFITPQNTEYLNSAATGGVIWTDEAAAST